MAVVLVVEDDVETSDNIKARLVKEGFDVLVCYDGLRALEIVRRRKPDVVVLDIMVPGLPGHHVCRLLKYDERFQQLPIVVVTGRTETDYNALAEKAGANAFLAKPFSMDELVRLIRRFVGGE
ncbi:MAG: response regulator [Planctomycetota bacterium]|nr:MAG: response regulator [Planctomycetota bacterium]